MSGIPSRLLPNTLELRKRVESFNDANEIIESFPPTGIGIEASVQDGLVQQLTLPDIDGPVIVNATIFVNYRTDVDHRDQVWQTDVDPTRRYRVIFVEDAAGRHHHLELLCERIQGIGEEAS